VKIVPVAAVHTDPHLIDDIVTALRDGGLVCFPVRGTYRLAADATNESAVLRLMQTKRRASNHPALLFVPSLEAARSVVTGTHWASSKRLAKHFWPRPLTLVLPPSDELPGKVKKLLTRATGKIGVRMPEDPLSERILAAFGGPILVSSANLERKPGSSSAAAIRQRFEGKLELWVDAGDTTPGPQSTLVAPAEGSWDLLREGAITRDELERALR
jgi:L-threonylcarbamoyladenylate synthase